MFKNTLSSLRKGPSQPRSQVSDKTSPNIKAMAEPAAAARHTKARPTPSFLQRLRARWRARVEEPAKGPVHLAIQSLVDEAGTGINGIAIRKNDLLPFNAALDLIRWLSKDEKVQFSAQEVAEKMKLVNGALLTTESEIAEETAAAATEVHAGLRRVSQKSPDVQAIAKALVDAAENDLLNAFRIDFEAFGAFRTPQEAQKADKTASKADRRTFKLHQYRAKRYFEALGEQALLGANNTPQEKTRLLREQKKLTRDPYRRNEFYHAGMLLQKRWIDQPASILQGLAERRLQAEEAAKNSDAHAFHAASQALVQAHDAAIKDLGELAIRLMRTHALSISLLPSERVALRTYGESILKKLIPFLSAPDSYQGALYQVATMGCSSDGDRQQMALRLLRGEPYFTDDLETQRSRIDPVLFELEPPETSEVQAPLSPPLRLAEIKVRILGEELRKLQAQQKTSSASSKAMKKRLEDLLPRQASKSKDVNNAIRTAQIQRVRADLLAAQRHLTLLQSTQIPDLSAFTANSYLSECQRFEQDTKNDADKAAEVLNRMEGASQGGPEEFARAETARLVLKISNRIHAEMEQVVREAWVAFNADEAARIDDNVVSDPAPLEADEGNAAAFPEPEDRDAFDDAHQTLQPLDIEHAENEAWAEEPQPVSPAVSPRMVEQVPAPRPPQLRFAEIKINVLTDTLQKLLASKNTSDVSGKTAQNRLQLVLPRQASTSSNVDNAVRAAQIQRVRADLLAAQRHHALLQSRQVLGFVAFSTGSYLSDCEVLAQEAQEEAAEAAEVLKNLESEPHGKGAEERTQIETARLVCDIHERIQADMNAVFQEAAEAFQIARFERQMSRPTPAPDEQS